MTMTNKLSLAFLVFGLLACGSDPTRDTGKPDAVPSSPEQAASQQTDLQARKEALQTTNLCTPEAIRKSDHPDERWYHCRGKPWTGSTFIADRLLEFQNNPQAHRDFCSDVYSKADNAWPVYCEGTDALRAVPESQR